MTGFEVTLYRYDLSRGMARQLAGPMLGLPMDGVWHTSLVFCGTEYFFDGGCGIAHSTPEQTPFGTPYSKESMGNAIKSLDEFERWCDEHHRTDFSGNSYRMMTHNCNHFTHEALLFLTGRGAPDDVVNMIPNMMDSPMASMLASFLVPGGLGVLPPGIRPERDPRARDFAEAQRRRDANSASRTGPANIAGDASSQQQAPRQRDVASFVEEVTDDADAGGAAGEVDTVTLQRVVSTIAEAMDNYGHADASLEELGSLVAALLHWLDLVNGAVQACRSGLSSVEPFKIKFDKLRALDRVGGHQWMHAAGWRLTSDDEMTLSPTHVASNLATFQAIAAASAEQASSLEAVYYQRIEEGCEDDPSAATSPAPAPAPKAPAATATATSPLPSRQSSSYVDPHPPALDTVLSGAGPLQLTTAGWKIAPIDDLDVLLAFTGTLPVAVTTEPYHTEAALKRGELRRAADAKCGGQPQAHCPIYVVHDMKGGYGSDAFVTSQPLGTRRADAWPYAPSYWPCVDGVVYFSHNLVCCPPPQWVSAAHRNGVKIYGTLKVEPRHGLWSRCQTQPQLIDSIVERLTALQFALGFDGWMFATSGVVPESATMQAFVAALYDNMKSVDAELLLWDSVTDLGAAEPQYGPTTSNAILIQHCHAFFSHYGGSQRTPSTVAAPAKVTVCETVDVFGRGRRGGGWGTAEAIKDVLRLGRGVAIFAPGWSTEKLASRSGEKSPAEQLTEALRHDAALWNAIADVVLRRAKDDNPLALTAHALPFLCTFNVGASASAQSPQLHYQRQDYTQLALPLPHRPDLELGVGSVSSWTIRADATTSGTFLSGPFSAVRNDAPTLLQIPTSAINRVIIDGVDVEPAPAFEWHLLLQVCYRAEETSPDAAIWLQLSGASDVASVLPLVGFPPQSSTLVVNPTWDTVSSEGWVNRRFVVRQLPARRTLPEGSVISLVVRGKSTSESGSLDFKSLSVDLIPVRHDGAPTSTPTVPKISVLSSHSAAARAQPLGYDPTSRLRVAFAASRFDHPTSLAQQLLFEVSAHDVAPLPAASATTTSASSLRSGDLRQGSGVVSSIRLLLGSTCVAELPVPCTTASVVALLRDRAVVDGDGSVTVTFQAVDRFGTCGGLRKVRVPIRG